MHLSAFASGYPRLYHSDEEELAAALGEARAARGGTGDPSNPRVFLWPTTIDFRAQASRRPQAVPVASFNGLLEAIRRTRELSSVHWFGHGAASGELQFGGGHNFGRDQLAALGQADVSSHFVSGGVITLFACNAGQRPEFLQGIANALRVRVAGFSRGVRWEVRPRGVSPRRVIGYRGVHGERLPMPQDTFAPR